MARSESEDKRILATWIDSGTMAASEDSGDDVAERAAAAERVKRFDSIEAAKAWAEANASLDEYGTPRVEVRECDCPDEVPALRDWRTTFHEEWVDGRWQELPSWTSGP
jgi:hypothetical protein